MYENIETHGSPKAGEGEFNYLRRNPTQSALYITMKETLPDFLAILRNQSNKKMLPLYVIKEMEDFLKCGVPSLSGISRFRCMPCKIDKFVAHSCKKRGFCPSCGARRMAQTTAHLMDYVFSNERVRQWVISFPFEMRLALAYDAKLMSRVTSIANKVISRYYIKKSGKCKSKKPQTASVVFVQRAGGQANCNPHLHIAFVEGVYFLKNKKHVKFIELDPPSNEDVAAVCREISDKVVSHLLRLGLFEMDQSDKMEGDLQLQFTQASMLGKVSVGSRVGQWIRRIGNNPENENSGTFNGERCFKFNGFSLHCNSFSEKDKKAERERLLRYMARPPLSNERLKFDKNGDVILKLKNKFKDGTHSLKFSSLELVEKVSSIIPPPWKNLVKYFGAFAPNSKFRRHVIPKQQIQSLKLLPKAYYLKWQELLKRTFKIDTKTCFVCGGEYRYIGSIFDQHEVTKILKAINWDTGPPKPKLKDETRYEYHDF